MKINLQWNDLLIEEGKLDPLGLWRVGDRLNDELLRPFTTVVLSRPARYFSMYAWIIHVLDPQAAKDKRDFWKRFFELEAVFLCAIQLHESHTYVRFTGQIGSEHAKDLIANAKKGLIALEKIRNGWEVNYKSPMFQFHLLEIDYSSPVSIRLTDIGENIALAFQNSISQTRFFKHHKSNTKIPVDVIKELADHACPCLLKDSTTKALISERDTIIKNMLTDNPYADRDSEVRDLLGSIQLITSSMAECNSNSVPFSKPDWHRMLTTGYYSAASGMKSLNPLKKHEIYLQRWQVYTLDLLLVYALESGLSGFLQYLHASSNDLKINQLENALKDIFSNGVNNYKIGECEEIVSFTNNKSDYVNRIYSADCKELFVLEQEIVAKISASSSGLRMFYAFVLYVYIQTKFMVLQDAPDYKDTMSFYYERANRDGRELSLFHTTEVFRTFDLLDAIFFAGFFKQWIFDRQLLTRNTRGKEVAWFSCNDELNSINFESAYSTNIYRASRIEILMSYLLNLEIVEYQDNDWSPNLSSPFYKAKS